ncbi:hypothetical protein ASE63_10945 [Bosea sp. Root381]|nr:hypothetical protein ASE63_10945 [Bosea sp. Root381]
MRITRSTCYNKPAISIDDTALVGKMVASSVGFEAYGYRRMHAALRHRRHPYVAIATSFV